MHPQRRKRPIERAIAAVGGPRQLAELLGVTRPAVLKWRTSQVPAERVLMIELHTGVSRHDLRPDIYPRHLTAAEDRSSV